MPKGEGFVCQRGILVPMHDLLELVGLEVILILIGSHLALAAEIEISRDDRRIE